MINRFVLLSVVTITTSCLGPKAVSTLETNVYDDKKNLTTFTKIPFGSTSIPGKWKEVSYNQVSKQHNFENEDSVWTAIAINQASAYSFYKPNLMSYQIAKEFYEWDSKYLAEISQGTRTIIKEDTVHHFIIWQITGAAEEKKVDNLFLFGCENGIIFNLFVSTTKWTDGQKIEHLQTIYENKTVGNCCK